MDPFSYVSYMTSIVLALGIARIVTGFGKILERRGAMALYPVHLLWALNLLLLLLLNWWILYRWHTHEHWTFFLFLFVLLDPIVSYLLTVLLFPDHLNPDRDLKAQYYAGRRWFFALGALLPVIDAVDTLLKGHAYWLTLGSIYPITLVTQFVLMIVASRTDGERFHWFFAVFFLLHLLVFILIDLNILV